MIKSIRYSSEDLVKKNCRKMSELHTYMLYSELTYKKDAILVCMNVIGSGL